jgi:hypothetical protein
MWRCQFSIVAVKYRSFMRRLSLLYWGVITAAVASGRQAAKSEPNVGLSDCWVPDPLPRLIGISPVF